MSYEERIEKGLQEKDLRTIEEGLSQAYDYFVEYTLGDRQNELLALGRNLNSLYYPYRHMTVEPSDLLVSYLGQIRALTNLCDYISQRSVPASHWRVVGQSKYGKVILQALLESGAMLATDLGESISIPNKTQLSRTLLPLVEEGLVRREKHGKNVWYSLTSAGRLITSKHLERWRLREGGPRPRETPILLLEVLEYEAFDQVASLPETPSERYDQEVSDPLLRDKNWARTLSR